MIFSILTLLLINSSFVSNYIKNQSYRVYEIIYNTSAINQDRSYQIRLAMIEKGLILFKQNPFFGIGAGNFTDKEVIFNQRFLNTDIVVNKETINETSSHNSYIALISESGLVSFIPFLLIIFYNLFCFFRFYNLRQPIENSFYWSFIVAVTHMFFINALFNIYIWVLIAIVSTLSVNSSENKFKFASTS